MKNKTIYIISLVVQFFLLAIFYYLTNSIINQYTSFINNLFGNIAFISISIFFWGYWFLNIIWLYFMIIKNFNPYLMKKRYGVFSLLFLITGGWIGIANVFIISFQKDESKI